MPFFLLTILHCNITDTHTQTRLTHIHCFSSINVASKSWMEKVCKTSLEGRALSCLQCAMMINNNLVVKMDHVVTEVNFIADSISRIKCETDIMHHFKALMQAYPELSG